MWAGMSVNGVCIDVWLYVCICVCMCFCSLWRNIDSKKWQTRSDLSKKATMPSGGIIAASPRSACSRSSSTSPDSTCTTCLTRRIYSHITELAELPCKLIHLRCKILAPLTFVELEKSKAESEMTTTGLQNYLVGFAC